MPHFQELPPWLRVIGRGLRITTYLMLLLVGVGDLVYPSDRIADQIEFSEVWGSILVVMGLLAVVAVVFRRWRVEWIVSFWLAAAVAIRAVVVWSSPGPPPPLADGSLSTLISAFLILRGLDLTVFALRTQAWAVRLRKA